MSDNQPDKQEVPERIRLLIRNGRIVNEWYYPDAAVGPFDAEFAYARVVATGERARLMGQALDSWEALPNDLKSDLREHAPSLVAAILALCDYTETFATPLTDCNRLRQVASMALQQFEFQYGKRRRGWDAQFLMEQISTAIAEYDCSRARVPSGVQVDAEGFVAAWVAALQDESHVTDEDAEDLTLRLIAYVSERTAASGVVGTVDRSLYSELIHIAAELARADGFLSTCAEDMAPRLKRSDILITAERQDDRLKDWAWRVRQVANKLSVDTAPIAAPLGYEYAITVDWNKHNARRHELIEAKRSRRLSDDEATEFRELQWLAGIKRELLTGPPIPEPDQHKWAERVGQYNNDPMWKEVKENVEESRASQDDQIKDSVSPDMGVKG